MFEFAFAADDTTVLHNCSECMDCEECGTGCRVCACGGVEFHLRSWLDGDQWRYAGKCSSPLLLDWIADNLPATAADQDALDTYLGR